MENFKFGLQLYSIRENMEKDFEGSLKKVKAMGYDGVEFAGLFSQRPETVRNLLDILGLEAISAHVPYQEMSENLEIVIYNYKTIGCKYIAIPYLAEDIRPGSLIYDQVLQKIEHFGKIFKNNDITLLYHNHDFEFLRLESGKYALDEMYDRIPASYLQTELDTCWISVAGESPGEYIRKYAGRCPVIHLKDYYMSRKSKQLYELIGRKEEKTKDTILGDFEFRPVGHGQQDFKKIITAAAESNTKWLIVEQDRSDDIPALEAVKKSLDYLKHL